MPFYSEIGADPKRSFRFLFYLSGQTEGQASTLRPYTVKQVKKPTFQMEGGPQVKYIQHTFKYPGRVVWQDVSVTVIDPGGAEDAGVALYNMLSRSGYSVPIGDTAATKRSISKGEANKAIGSPKLEQINAAGQSIEKWTLHNAFLSSVDFGEVSYDSDEIINITLNIMYDYATLSSEQGGASVDAAISSKG